MGIFAKRLVFSLSVAHLVIAVGTSVPMVAFIGAACWSVILIQPAKAEEVDA